MIWFHITGARVTWLRRWRLCVCVPLGTVIILSHGELANDRVRLTPDDHVERRIVQLADTLELKLLGAKEPADYLGKVIGQHLKIMDAISPNVKFPSANHPKKYIQIKKEMLDDAKFTGSGCDAVG